jgi:hypothetical protein
MISILLYGSLIIYLGSNFNIRFCPPIRLDSNIETFISLIIDGRMTMIQITICLKKKGFKFLLQLTH